MHDSTYLLVKDSHKLLDTILDCIRNKKDPQGNPIAGWKIIQNVSVIAEIDLVTACIASTIDGEDKKTCIILHACRGAKKENEDFKMPDYIHATPHFITEFANYNYCPNQELENLLKRFDDFVETRFAGSIIDGKYICFKILNER